MTSILQRLKDALTGAGAEPVADTQTVRHIVAELDALEPDRARYIAAFAVTLSRVAIADEGISEKERGTMEAIVQRVGHLPPEQARLVVEIAETQTRRIGHTQDYLVTREFTEISTPDQRRELLDCLLATAAADDAISGAEEAQIRQIANELKLTHQDFVAARAAYSDKRTVMKLLHETKEPP